MFESYCRIPQESSIYKTVLFYDLVKKTKLSTAMVTYLDFVLPVIYNNGETAESKDIFVVVDK